MRWFELLFRFDGLCFVAKKSLRQKYELHWQRCVCRILIAQSFISVNSLMRAVSLML